MAMLPEIFCERCGVVGHDAVYCLADRDQVYAYRQYKQSHYSSFPPRSITPHPSYQRGFQEPSYSFSPQEPTPAPAVNNEEFDELKSLLATLTLQVEQSRNASIESLTHQVAQVTIEPDYDVYNSDFEDDDFIALFDKEIPAEKLVDRAPQSSRSTNFDKELVDRAPQSSRSTEFYEELLDRAPQSDRSTAAGEEFLDRVATNARSRDFGEEEVRSREEPSRSTTVAAGSIELASDFVQTDDEKVNEGHTVSVEGTIIPFVDSNTSFHPSVNSYTVFELTPPPQLGSNLEEHRYISSYAGLTSWNPGKGSKDSIPPRKKTRQRADKVVMDAMRSHCLAAAVIWRTILKLLMAEITAFSQKPQGEAIYFLSR